MNKVILRGHLGADVRFNTTTTNQKPVANFRMATNKTYNDAAGNKVKTAEWHNVVCWNRLAETVAEFCRKGSNVLVEGEVRTREFMGQTQYENGQVVVDGAGNPIMVKRYTTEIVAKSVEFLDKPQGTTAYPNAQPGVVAAAPVVAQAPVYAQAPPVVAAAGNPAAAANTFVGAGAVHPNAPMAAPPAYAPPAGVAAPNTVQPVIIPGV